MDWNDLQRNFDDINILKNGDFVLNLCLQNKGHSKAESLKYKTLTNECGCGLNSSQKLFNYLIDYQLKSTHKTTINYIIREWMMTYV